MEDTNLSALKDDPIQNIRIKLAFRERRNRNKRVEGAEIEGVVEFQHGVRKDASDNARRSFGENPTTTRGRVDGGGLVRAQSGGFLASTSS